MFKSPHIPEDIPFLVFSDASGNIMEHPFLRMAGRSASVIHPVPSDDLIPLPYGSELFVLPDRAPVGWDMERNEMVALYEGPDGEDIYAVAAFMAPAYTQTALSAFVKKDSSSPPLPLFAYTAVGWRDGKFWVAGFRSDRDRRQDIRLFDRKRVIKATKRRIKASGGNRLIQHLGKCSLQYGCPAAKNFFLGRFEAPLPTSTSCNASCLGCLSLQDKGSKVPSTHERMGFIPSVSEICEVALSHIGRAKRPIVSFGQGCEGEPLTNYKLLSEAIKEIRKKTAKGTINLNTNASIPEGVELLRRSGLNSIRISMNSIRKEYYMRYYRPRGYSLDDVLASWGIMKDMGGFVSINLFIMPGVSDDEAELNRLCEYIDRFGIDLIQLRNHNIDPDWYLEHIDYAPSGNRLGIKGMARRLKRLFPHIKFGYFNRYIGQ